MRFRAFAIGAFAVFVVKPVALTGIIFTANVAMIVGFRIISDLS